MQGLSIVFLIIGVLILIVNSFSILGNIFKIASYCLKINKLGPYWELFFKNSVSARALISSVIGTILALGVFLIITPIVLLKSANAKSNTMVNNPAAYNAGLSAQTQQRAAGNNSQTPQNLKPFFLTNVQDFGFETFELKVAGVLRIDAILAIAGLEKYCKEKNISFSYEVMKEVTIPGASAAVSIPLVFDADGKKYSTYFIYTPEDLMTFKALDLVMEKTEYPNFIYFSNLDMA